MQDQKIRQKYVVDAAVYCNLVAAGSSDDVKDVPSHTAIYRWLISCQSLFPDSDQLQG